MHGIYVYWYFLTLYIHFLNQRYPNLILNNLLAQYASCNVLDYKIKMKGNAKRGVSSRLKI